jgi:hypothetical protein
MDDRSDEFSWMNFIGTSSNIFDDDTEVVVVVTVLSHDHEENQRPLYRGSLPGRCAALDHNREAK